jgi:hypothetical protein
MSQKMKDMLGMNIALDEATDEVEDGFVDVRVK